MKNFYMKSLIDFTDKDALNRDVIAFKCLIMSIGMMAIECFKLVIDLMDFVWRIVVFSATAIVMAIFIVIVNPLSNIFAKK